MRLLDKDAILQEDFSDEFWEPVDYSSFRALISIYPEVDIKAVDIKTEVAKEIFAEIDIPLQRFMCEHDYSIGNLIYDVDELKNKYTKGE